MEVAFLIATFCSLFFAAGCLWGRVFFATGWWGRVSGRWCVSAASCLALSFAALVAFDYWQNSVATFPKGAFPRERYFYAFTPAVALVALVGGVVDLSRFQKRESPNQGEPVDRPPA